MLHLFEWLTFFIFHVGRLTIGRVCNLQCNDESSISSFIATDRLSASSSWCRGQHQILISLFDSYFVFSLTQSQSLSYFTADGQSVSKSWCRAQSGTFDQRYYFFFFEGHCPVIRGTPFWQEVGFVMCQSFVNTAQVVCRYLHRSFTMKCTISVTDTLLLGTIYTIYTKYIRPRSVQALYSRFK
jgi:hypothetical protein